ncbi:MAG: hypothetical protein KF889_09415 [Alphaproteobacteria bacterium]|nr:hypothetical protein [Alphaproteobacteria bacterium]MCW5741040.1 hypothetical protein [Alphaproteobacteria bacterium]
MIPAAPSLRRRGPGRARRYACALVVAVLSTGDASARNDPDLTDVARFCSAVAHADSATLDRAAQRIDAIKREIAALAALEAKRDRLAAEAAAEGDRVAGQRRDVEALRTRLTHLSPAMFEERRLTGADLTAHLEVLDRYRQSEAVLLIELRAIEDEIAARRARADLPAQRTVATSERELRRCIEERRARLR